METNLVILTRRVNLPYVNIIRSPIPCKWSNTHQIGIMIVINTKIEYTLRNMSLDTFVCNSRLFWTNNVIFNVKLEAKN